MFILTFSWDHRKEIINYEAIQFFFEKVKTQMHFQNLSVKLWEKSTTLLKSIRVKIISTQCFSLKDAFACEMKQLSLVKPLVYI
jgi:penicillin-binding protein-related factor A (putative recombinase)